MRSAYAAFLLLLAVWGMLASLKHLSAKRPWCARRWLIIFCIVLLVSGCLTSGVALLTARFAPWMLLPIGVSYVAMLPWACYFPWITVTAWRRAMRNALFIIFAVFLLALGFGIIPLSVIGL